MCDCAIVLLFLFIWALSYYVSNKSSTDLLNTKGFIDCINKAKWFESSFILESIALMFIIVKLVWIFRISRYIHWVLISIDAVSSTKLNDLYRLLTKFFHLW